MTTVRPLRLLMLYDCLYPGSLGGVEARNFELARALAARGHRVVLAGFADQGSSPSPGVEVVPLGPPGRLYTARGKRSTREAVRYAAAVARLDLASFDAVETANIPYLHLFPLAWRCARARLPLVVTWHEYWGAYWRRYLGGPHGWLFALVERLCAPLGAQALAVSELTAGRLRRSGGRRDARVVPNGVPVERIRQAGAGAAPGAPLVYAGRLLSEKRVDLLVTAVSRLPPRSAGPWLVVVGDGPARGHLEELARELGAAAAVRFTGRLASSEEVWRHLAAAKVAVQPSSREGFGLFPLEAMAAGLPVVYCESPESALPELVRCGREGISAPPDPDSLAQALRRLLDDPSRLRELSAGARLRADAYSWEQVAVRFEQEILRLLEAYAGGGRSRARRSPE